MESTPIQAGRLSDLIKTEFPPQQDWVGPGVLPKSCKMIFGGCTKIGKTFFLTNLGKALALGESPFNCPWLKIEKPTKVLYIDHELKPFGLQQRVLPLFTERELKRIEEQFWYVSGRTEIHFSSVEGRKYLERLIAETKPEVLILDPIGKMHFFDENSSPEINKLMKHLEDLIAQGREWGMSLVFAHHFGKPNRDPQYEKDPLDHYNFRGASKWCDDQDALVTAHRYEELATSYEAWRVKTRWLLRHAQSLPDMHFTVNAKDDRFVRFEKADEKGQRKLPSSKKEIPPLPKEDSGRGFAAI